jgi:molybdate transport system substrate-binding protein
LRIARDANVVPPPRLTRDALVQRLGCIPRVLAILNHRMGGVLGPEDLNDLTEDHVQLVLAAEGVPAGDYAREIFENAGISKAALANVVSNEEDVKAVITKVMSGEADAGIGYVTDVTPDVADRVTLIPIPDDVNVIATYPIAVVNGSQEADLAQGFVDYVLGDGQQTLAEYGFLPPP